MGYSHLKLRGFNLPQRIESQWIPTSAIIDYVDECSGMVRCIVFSQKRSNVLNVYYILFPFILQADSIFLSPVSQARNRRNTRPAPSFRPIFRFISEHRRIRGKSRIESGESSVHSISGTGCPSNQYLTGLDSTVIGFHQFNALTLRL